MIEFPLIDVFLDALLLFIPAYIANAAPPILAHTPGLRGWDAPIDFGKTFRGRRIFGKNKTWRGMIGGTILAGLFFLAHQAAGYPMITQALPWYYGFLLGFGAIFVGDCGESFIKRQAGIDPGKPFIPWDQTDFVLGAMIMTFWIYWPGWYAFFFLFIVSGLVSWIAHVIGYFLRLNKNRI